MSKFVVKRRTQTRLWEKEIADNIDMEKFHRKYGEKGFEVCRGIHMDVRTQIPKVLVAMRSNFYHNHGV